jgi:hypothetical protein
MEGKLKSNFLSSTCLLKLLAKNGGTRYYVRKMQCSKFGFPVANPSKLCFMILAVKISVRNIRKQL